ncbi:hypothetical protein BH10PSE6_BH10PSE6_39900 [soil metagenome]
MYWVIQDKLREDAGLRTLRASLPRWGIPHSFHEVIPFVGELRPDVNAVGKVIVIGSYSMRHAARAKGWVPGCFDIGHLTHEDFVQHWGVNMLNASGFVEKFPDVPKHPLPEEFFCRPAIDSKAWAGAKMMRADFLLWHEKVMAIIDEPGVTITRDTEVVVAPIRSIAQEYRCWIVDRQVVTTSLYKRDEQVLHDTHIDDDVLGFARSMAKEPWQPDRAYVLDVSLDVEGQTRVIEVNTLNAAGFYAADIQKLVEALEEMEF